jgi:hypothetical protein
MNTKTDTKKFGYSIIVPTDKNPSVPTVYKVYFGKKYLIWKGKSLLQSCEILAKSISATLSKLNKGEKIPETDYLIHVVRHIKATKRYSATVSVEANEFFDEYDQIDGGKLLRLEQQLLDEADGDPLCLNNNEQAYVPINNIWISEETKQKFLNWYARRKKK